MSRLSSFVNLAWAGGFGAAVALLTVAGCETIPESWQTNSWLRQRSIEQLETGHPDKAEPMLVKAVNQDPTDWKARFLLGGVRNQQHRGLDAQLLLEQALALRFDDEETPDILDALAEAIYIQNRPDALTTFLAEQASKGLTTRDFLRQARYLGKIGDADGAALALRKAAAMAEGSGSPVPYVALADYYWGVGDHDKAFAYLKQAYNLDPNHPAVISRLRSFGALPASPSAAGPTAALPSR